MVSKKHGKSGNPNFKNKWNHGDTCSIRVPISLKEEIKILAQLLDRGKITLEQIEEIAGEIDHFKIDRSKDKIKVMVNCGDIDSPNYVKTIFDLSKYPPQLDQWEDGQIKKILRELKLITGQPQKFIFQQFIDYASELPLIELQIWQ